MPVTIKTGVGGGSVTLDSGTGVLDTTLTLPNINGTVLYSDANGTSNIANITATTLAVSGNVTGNLTIAGTLTAANSNVTGTVVMSSSFKRNRIINGNMVIDQRNAGASVTATDGQYSVDRWQFSVGAASKFTAQQNAGSVTSPTGFTNYLGITSSSAYSIGATEGFGVKQRVEGYNVADLGWGAAGASTVTLSFWVRSSLTGTFGGVFFNAAANRFYVFSYTISAANTWEQKSVTIAGDTSGTWNKTNDTGIEVFFCFGAGSSRTTTAGSWGSTLYLGPTGQTSVVGTNGATFYITGVQLEVGTKATPYELQIYSDQLAQCQRYYETSFASGTAPANGGSVSTFANGATNIAVAAPWTNNLRQSAQIRFFVPKRSTPTMTTYGNSSGYWGYISSGTLPTSGTTFTFTADVNAQSPDSTSLYVNNQVSQSVLFNVAGGWAANSEL